MIFYALGLWLYALLIRFASLFNDKARLMVDGRKNLFNRMQNEMNPQDRHIWIHAASLGEFEQGRPVIERIKKDYPNYKIVLTFFSPSGYEIRRDYDGADYVYYMPLDSARNAKHFMDIVSPEKAFFIKYEFWYFFLRELKRREISTFIFSTIFRKEQVFFKWYGGLWRKMLGMFDHLFVQNADTVELLKKIGIKNVSIAGDTRFDRVADIASHAKRLPLIESFAKNSKVAVCGSTWPKDEDNIIKYITEINNDYKWIIAPHETHKKHVDEIVDKLNGDVILYSQANEDNVVSSKVLIIDSIGILSSVYQYADFSYIGGGFGVGIHNTLEAATFGLPIVFGPNYLRFKEAVDMVEYGSAFSYNEFDDLHSILNALTKVEKYMRDAGEISARYVADNVGATELIVDVAFRD